ncbi:hypothetical protein [Streptomyces radicis]|uniref:Sugar ABC transporter permease n=1 Tax=Streptomyces radicis TaxID=1750517 RepID=A0A3A9VR21_9ACTN|nr:hypothetical protein [Streptomyces radicis]RKN03150.1 hypothetical protein D7319_32160 [Streptomyces radicis]RKN13067.1 hypothetical protein D7318_32035 [Streptomyces radicis]
MNRSPGGSVAAAPAPSTTVTARVRRRGSSRANGALARRRSLTGLLLISPALLLVGVFFLWPLGMTVWMSFHRWPLLGTPEWTGLDNYAAIPGNETLTVVHWIYNSTFANFQLGYGSALSVLLLVLLLIVNGVQLFLLRDRD